MSNLMKCFSANKMKFEMIAVASLLFVTSACFGQQDRSAGTEGATTQMKDRWFFSFGNKRNREGVDKIKSLIDRGADHGFNGMVLSTFGLGSITDWNKTDIALLKEVADHCKKKHIELIPTAFSAGYGGGALRYDRNFAAALPATILLRAEGQKAIPISGKNLLVNGDMEDHTRDRFKGWAFVDSPGEISFADTMSASGKTSVRFENFTASKSGNGRLMQIVSVQPRRCYRISFQLKTQDLQPTSKLKIMVNSKAGRSVVSLNSAANSTQDWTRMTLDFVSTGSDEVMLYAGVWGGKSGKFWLDDFRLHEQGSLSNIARREGTPLALRSRDRDVEFVEGKDFRTIRCLRELNHLKLLSGTSIREGEQLKLSCYKIPGVSHSWGQQTSLCMSNPELYDYWDAQAKRLHEVIEFKRFLLAMDEIRNGGGCASCRQRNISMAQILGDCITRQHAIFKAIDPEIEVMIWSDMLDPAHNARNNFYGVVGDFTGSWEYVPKDLTIMCWHHKIRDQSLSFFSGKGFRTFGAAYYDADDLTSSKEWLTSLRKTPHSQGIMYTTWRDKYKLLAKFGDFVSEDAAD